MSDRLEFALHIARAAGQVLRERFWRRARYT